MIALLATLGAWIARRFAVVGIGTVTTLAFLGPLGPIVSGVATAVSSLLIAISEIVASLAKSAEGRVVLGIILTCIGFFYLRFHYIEEGKELAIKMAAHKPCEAQDPKRRRK